MIRVLAVLIGAALIGVSIFTLSYMLGAPLFASALVSALAGAGIVLLIYSGEGER